MFLVIISHCWFSLWTFWLNHLNNCLFITLEVNLGFIISLKGLTAVFSWQWLDGYLFQYDQPWKFLFSFDAEMGVSTIKNGDFHSSISVCYNLYLLYYLFFPFMHWSSFVLVLACIISFDFRYISNYRIMLQVSFAWSYACLTC